jgi:hypothetical protein
MNIDAGGSSQRLSLCKPEADLSKDPMTGQKPATSVEDAVSPNLQKPLCDLSLRIAPALSAISLSDPAFGFDGCDKLRC